MSEDTLASRLNRLIAERGMTQKALAEGCGCTQAAMSRYCSGQRVPRSDTAAAMARALGVPLDALLGCDAVPGPDELAYAVSLVCSRMDRLSPSQREELIRALAK
jgi:transcriptional regulator with XRE-family HTH domain